jgi:hypothetical protein
VPAPFFLTSCFENTFYFDALNALEVAVGFPYKNALGRSQAKKLSEAKYLL